MTYDCMRCGAPHDTVTERNEHQLTCRGSIASAPRKAKPTGDVFESLVNDSCDALRPQGLSVRQHGPRFIGRVGPGGIATGRVVSKGGLDFEGSLLTRWVAFEAKSTKVPRLGLDWKHVKPHQAEAVKDAWARGDVAFFLIEFSGTEPRYFAMAWDSFGPWWDAYQAGGRASIPLPALTNSLAIPVRHAGKVLDIVGAIKSVAARLPQHAGGAA